MLSALRASPAHCPTLKRDTQASKQPTPPALLCRHHAPALRRLLAAPVDGPLRLGMPPPLSVDSPSAI